MLANTRALAALAFILSAAALLAALVARALNQW